MNATASSTQSTDGPGARAEHGRESVVVDLDEAVADIGDGAVLGIGGAVTSAHPMALVRALARRAPRDLTIVAPTAGMDVDLLVAMGCVRTVITSYVGIEAVAGVCPAFRAAVERGELEVRDLDEAHCIAGLQAAAQRLPFMPWRGGLGTALTQLNPDLVEFDDPIAGERLLAVPALALDFALIYAETADVFGNAQAVGTGNMDPLIGSAAKTVILQVDRVVSNETIRRSPGSTCFWRQARVVRAPWGTHPYSSAWMVADSEHLAQWTAAAQAAAKGDDTALRAYVERYVQAAASHEDYVEAVGSRQLSRLAI